MDIANSFTKEPGTSNSAETIFYAFPFAVPDSVFHIDIPGVVAKYPDEFRPETHWNYMPAQSFVSVSNERMNIVLATREAPNFSFRRCGSISITFLYRSARRRIFAMPLTKQTVNKHDFDHEAAPTSFATH